MAKTPCDELHHNAHRLCGVKSEVAATPIKVLLLQTIRLEVATILVTDTIEAVAHMAFGGRLIAAALFRAFTTLLRLHVASMCCVRLADGTGFPNVELYAAGPILAFTLRNWALR